MPYIAGETLRGRIDRERPLSVEDALRLAREVADALAYAHANDVIHRDIKPENILLSEGHALVGDFGIAHAVSRAGFRRLTDAGFAIGTLSYMSPEQGSGDPIDGRSDLYSLGCVLYETLTGKVPFSGADGDRGARARVTASRRHPAPATARRAAGGDATVLKAFAATAAKRFQSMAAFSAALAVRRTRVSRDPVRSRSRPVALDGGCRRVGSAPALFFAFRPAPLDPELYVVLPFVHRAGAAPQLLDGDNCQQLLYEAFGRWNGITLVDDMRAHDARARNGGTPLSLDDALRTARSLHAGRLAWGEVWVDRGNIQVRGLIYDVGRQSPIKQYAVTLRGDLGDAERKFDGARRHHCSSLSRPRESRRCRRAARACAARDRSRAHAYFRAHEAFAAWQLDSAETLFRPAIDLDPKYPHANYWLAQVMAWRGERTRSGSPTPSARCNVDATLAARQHYRRRAARSRGGTFPEACARYEQLRAREDSLDFAVWYGLGDCRARDTVIVKSAASPSGWRFAAATRRRFAHTRGR